MDDPIDLLFDEIPLFADLGFDEADIVKKHLLLRRINAGDTIFKEGSHANSVCFVCEGELDVVKTKDGRNPIIAKLSAGQAVGEMAIIDGLTRSATIKAHTAAKILILKRSDFQQLIDTHPTIGIKMLKGLARMLSANLRKTSETLTKLTVALSQ